MNALEISKRDFAILFYVEFQGDNYPKELAKQLKISENEAEAELLRLEKKGLIKIEYREGEIYGSQLTGEGAKIFNDDKYINWKVELGY